MANLTNGDDTPIMTPTSDERTPLLAITEGMSVHDSAGKRIGKVRNVRMGGNDPVDAGRQANEAGTNAPDSDVGGFASTLITGLGETFASDESALPDEERQNLLNKGYIQIDSSGLFAADRFATPDQIARVDGDGVHLNVDQDELLPAR
jgi:hypothetical protein